MSEGRIAFVAGATGLVGGALLRLLLEEGAWSRVVAFGRRAPELRHPRLEPRRPRSESAADWEAAVEGDDVFCALGSTLRAAGSREAFRRVDLEYPSALARGAARAGCRSFSLVSSVGADPSSRFFYLRVKGEAERAASAGPPRLRVHRPSFLLGRRSPPRHGEAAAAALLAAAAPLLAGPLARCRPLPAETVARAMLRAALDESPGRRVLEVPELEALGAA